MATSLELDDLRDYRPCWEPEEVIQVLEGLDRLSNRASPQAQRRKCERKAYAAGVLVMQNRHAADGPKPVLHVVARNLSQSGVGLLAPLFFEPEVPCKQTPMLRAANIFRDGGVLEVGLWKPSGTLIWLFANVIRARTVQHDFLDIGLRFMGRRNVTEELEF